jgi:hypothetical protein
MIRCESCGSDKIAVQVVQDQAVTKKKGFYHKLGRAFLVVCTCGLWLFVPSSAKKSKTEFKNKTIFVCQACGHLW